uniref:Uncharacterized protein n=1 Tax=Mycena chlorophos TaxID=658473 RepID=A0ABQ0L6M2_MYCCL|nr:predicted protein [Mycena chlorophos]
MCGSEVPGRDWTIDWRRDPRLFRLALWSDDVLSGGMAFSFCVACNGFAKSGLNIGSDASDEGNAGAGDVLEEDLPGKKG